MELQDKIDSLIEEFSNSAVRGALSKFEENFKSNPAYAFEWAQNAMEAAARFEVALTLKAWTELPEYKPEAALSEIKRLVLRGARWPERSTSPVSNAMSADRTAAWAEALERITNGF